jgi:hypothetical protein
VYVHFEKSDIKCLLSWPKKASLNEIVNDLGAQTGKALNYTTELVIGEDLQSNEKWRLYVNDWCAGVIPPGIDSVEWDSKSNFPLGGILGAALAVGITFLKAAGFDHSIGSEAVGLSLWRPDLPWTDPISVGPAPTIFPEKLWILGLGHLGQAYSWLIGLLPFKNPQNILIKLQDDDRAYKGNYDSGMLCEIINEGQYKTRICAAWLEARGITTKIVERKYDDNYHRQSDDPEIVIVGVDNLTCRKSLKVNEFKLVVDCGLGAGLNFDMIRLHVFPNLNLNPYDLWKDTKMTESTPALKLLSEKLVGCGYTIGIASAFTGCFSACLAISEILRSYHQGIKLSHGYISIREIQNINFAMTGSYRTEAFSGLAYFY